MVEQFLMDVVLQFGLFGIFLVSAISSASIIFPLPFSLIAIPAGAVFNPILVAIVAGVGAAVGEMIAYGVGAGGKFFIKPEHKKWFKKAKRWMKGRKAFFVIIVFAATPLPHDVVGLLSGFLHYDIKKFFIATTIGKIILFMVLAYIGFFGINLIMGM